MRYWFAVLMFCSGAALASGGGGDAGGPAGLVPLEPIVVNLRDGHFLQLRPLLKMKDALDADFVKGHTPVVRFELIKSLIGKSPAEVQGVKFMGDFSATAAAALNKALKDEYIKEVLFDSWLVQ